MPSVKIHMKIIFKIKWFLMEVTETQSLLWLLKRNLLPHSLSSGSWVNERHPALLPSGLRKPSSIAKWPKVICEIWEGSRTWEIKPPFHDFLLKESCYIKLCLTRSFLFLFKGKDEVPHVCCHCRWQMTISLGEWDNPSNWWNTEGGWEPLHKMRIQDTSTASQPPKPEKS